MSIKFIMISGAKAGKIEEFNLNKITIGRAANSDLVLDPKKDLDASKDHAIVNLENGEYWIIDQGSTNGTYLNGKRINKEKIEDGDEVQFGKGGPRAKIEISGAVAAGAPKTRAASSIEADKGSVGSQTVAMMINDALEKAKSSKKGAIGGTAVFIKEAVNSAIRKSSRTFKVMTSLVILVLVAAIVYLVIEGQTVKTELEQEKEERAKLEQQTDKMLGDIKSDKDKFYNIVKEYNRSVVFIYSETSIYDAKGNTANVVQGFGTGFFVRDDGYLLTNKHVVYPWKFDPDQAYVVALAKANNLKVETFVCVWINGERFRAGGRFSFENSYNTKDGNLEITTTAEDRMTQAFRKPQWRRGIEVEVHRRDNNDIAVLKAIGGSFKSVKIYRGRTPYKPTDPVIVYGFPLGISPQELANTSASAAFGRIRKIENTVQLDVSVLPGNSGGPVFTEDGSVIGIMTRRFAETLNECITIDHALRLVPGL